MADLTLAILGYALLAVTCIMILLSIDDIIIDLSYWCLRATGGFTRMRAQQVRDKSLEKQPSRRLAIMVPAWQESDVILSMLRSNLEVLDYGRVEFFVGVYQNDPDTLAEVNKARDLSARVHVVIVPHDGPTCKADCLNEIIRKIRTLDTALCDDEKFGGFILHDAEDLIHPLELSLFNTALVDYDFIQLPVYSFTRRTFDWFGAAYMDEFAESHGKDLLVRTWASDFTPCAGVGACFSRKTIEALGASTPNGDIFKPGSLTEDYNVAFRIAALGLKSTFLHWQVPFFLDTLGGRGAPRRIKKPMVISTRENFPSSFRAAYRQRARWVLGIAVVGTQEFGWQGNLSTRFFLLRDRKGLLAGPLIIIGYILFCASLIVAGLADNNALDALFNHVPFSSPGLFVIVSLIMLWRILQRYYFTKTLYGWRHGCLAIPRVLISNLINFFAVGRALRLFLIHYLTGKPLAWDKTPHTYPEVFPTRQTAPVPAAHTKADKRPQNACTLLGVPSRED
ncbi:MAG: glycosyl transferase family protein [Rhizobiaceae bacterium]|nr:glycosyl transferase family protein [Rhizobiaceae bacterium]